MTRSDSTRVVAWSTGMRAPDGRGFGCCPVGSSDAALPFPPPGSRGPSVGVFTNVFKVVSNYLRRGSLKMPKVKGSRHLAALIVCAAGFAAPAAAAARPPYVLAEQAEQALYETGLRYQGRSRTVLYAGCYGVSRPGPWRRDSLGARARTYRIFQCVVRVKTAPALTRIRLDTVSGTVADGWRYRWQQT